MIDQAFFAESSVSILSGAAHPVTDRNEGFVVIANGVDCIATFAISHFINL